jgi:hypothetical protein
MDGRGRVWTAWNAAFMLSCSDTQAAANRAVKRNRREHELSMMKNEKTDPTAMAIYPTGRGAF